MTLEEFIIAFRAHQTETKGKCFYCGVQTNKNGKQTHAVFHTRDHVIPRSAIRSYSDLANRANRVVCCRKCNALKEDLTLHEFKRRSGILVFFAEKFLNARIDDLSDIEEVTAQIVSWRKVEGRSIKFNGTSEMRNRELSSLHFLPSCPLDTTSADSASNE